MNGIIKKIISTILITATLLLGVNTRTENAMAATGYSVVFPVNNGMHISFAYGYSKSYGGNHSGIDISRYTDNTVYSAVDGVVVGTANSCNHISIGKKCAHYNTYGNMIIVKSTSGATSGMLFYYGHLKKDSLKVTKGAKVKAGQAIAKIGSSGYSTGYHLHFEVRKSDGKTKVNVNPTSKGGSMIYKNGPYGNVVTEKTISLKDGGKYYINAKCATNYYIGVSGNKTSNFSNVCLTTKANKSAIWTAHKYGDNWYFTNEASGKALDIYGNTVKSGSNTQIYSVNKNATQLFKLVTTDGVYCQIVSKGNSNVCVDVYGYGNYKSGTNIWTYSRNGHVSQMFRFVEV